ncbi:MAG: 4Fe-4S dicluster domain-containing protein [Chloroflexi bacterium]|nr:4Fe-4S dicluster domain-containing protein [Chloroflexota bacterium]
MSLAYPQNKSQQLFDPRRWVRSLASMDRRKKIRYALMAFGVLALAPPVGFLAQLFGGSMFCGPLCPRMAIGMDFLRELSSRTAGVILLFIWFGITFFFGRWACSHFCPVGALTEFGSKLVPNRFKIDYAGIVHAPLFRYGFLIAFVGLPILGLGSICCGYCNLSTIPEAFGVLFAPLAGTGLLMGSRLVSVVLYGGALGIAAREGRGHCQLVCPVGALDSLINVIGARLPFTFRMRVKKDNCISCGVCVEGCPAHAIKMNETNNVPEIDYHRCYQCRQCQTDCPTDTFSITRLKEGAS